MILCFFAEYDIWDDLAAWQMLLRGLEVICFQFWILQKWSTIEKRKLFYSKRRCTRCLLMIVVWKPGLVAALNTWIPIFSEYVEQQIQTHVSGCHKSGYSNAHDLQMYSWPHMIFTFGGPVPGPGPKVIKSQAPAYACKYFVGWAAPGPEIWNAYDISLGNHHREPNIFGNSNK